MYVQDRMTKNVITVRPDDTVSKVIDVMSQNNVRRVPVTDDDNNIQGVVTLNLINKNSPSNASSLSVFEINYLLNKILIKDIMYKDYVVVRPDMLLEEAASLMVEKSVGCAPVVDNNNKVVGIITRIDILSSFVDLLGYNKKGTRYVINVKDDNVGEFNKITKCFADEKISISNVAVYNTARGIEVVVIAVGDNSDKCKDALTKVGYNVTSMINLNK